MLEEKIKSLKPLVTKKKKTENLIVLLIILVIAVITINIFLSDKKEDKNNNTTGKELAVEIDKKTDNDIEDSLTNILSKIDGVGKVEVLVTYSETSCIVPLYNQKNTKSVTEETDTNGGKRTIENYDENKEVVSGKNSEPISEKVIMPKIEGAIIAAEGADNVNVKSNIVSAVEAVTGIPNYKIQVFKLK